MAEYFWHKIETDLTPIPSFIKHAFTMNGFGNALSFKDIDDEDIEAVEQFVRTQTLKILSKKLSESIGGDCDVLIDDDQLEEYFGDVYKEAPDKFKFLSGDRKLIKRLAEYVKEKVDGGGKNTGLKLFKQKPNSSKRAKKSAVDNIKDASAPNDGDEADLNDLLPQLKSTLFTKVIEWLKDHKVNEQMNLADINSNIVSVSTESGHVYGYIQCVICLNKPNGNKEKPKKISYRFDKGSQYWVSSNFITHLRSAHGLTAEKKNSKKKRKVEIVNKNADDCELMPDHNESVQIMSIENVPFPQMAVQDLYDQISKQITAMAQAVLENNEQEHAVSINLSDEKSTSINVVEADPDGNCLFKSLAHQLYHTKMQSAQIKKETKQLRAQVVAHIQQNIELYEHEIKGRVYDMIEDRKSNGELSESDSIDMDSEIHFFIHQLLPVNRYWGGSETFKAVSDLYNVNIVSFLENGTFSVTTTKEATSERTILVAYRCDGSDENKRNHYDSVTDISADDIYELVGLKQDSK